MRKIMKNKSILAIMLAVTMGFANAGIFDDIGNGIAGAADDVADFSFTR
jgi:outer membrane lipoprotein-sorting protein